jgi:site-specific recombinase XerD
LPKALHLSEVKSLLNHTENLKHHTLLKLIYGMGLRVSEIINLKIEHIDSKAMRVFIVRGKGKKNRYVNLPENILPQLILF